MGRRFLMTTTGTLGDLHPYVAVSIGLRQRGHEVTIATSEFYRTKIESEGIGFHPVRPDLRAIYRDSDVMRRAVDPITGTEFVVRQLLLPHLEESYEDLLQACRAKDLLVSHTGGTYALRLVAEKLQIPWVSIALQPLIFFSIYDPPVLPSTKAPHRFCGFKDWEYMLLFWSIKRRTRAWMEPVDKLRRRLGLAPAARHPMFEGVFSPYGTLAWFSALMGSQQQDWPNPTRITGFPFHDRQEAGQGLDPRLSEFLEKGEPPIVFTLGASAVLDSGDFFEQSITATRRLGRRAVLLIGPQVRSRQWSSLPGTVFVADYAPYSALLPLAAATVHHGGIGTTAQALRAGRPMLVVPYSNDQPDNAERVARLGVARVVYPRLYRAKRAQAELSRLLSDNSYFGRAAEVGQQIRAEEGVAAACAALEELAAAS